jgi:hypothetical protein
MGFLPPIAITLKNKSIYEGEKMSNTWYVHLRIEEVYNTEGANHPLRLQKTNDPYDPPTETNFFARNNNSDISGYKTLENENGDGFVELTASTVPEGEITILIKEFATSGEAVAEHTAEGSTSFKYSAWWSRGGLAADATVQAKCEVYHRDALGYETLITEFLQGITTTETQYTRGVTVNEIFEADERFVVKWYGKFKMKSQF